MQIYKVQNTTAAPHAGRMTTVEVPANGNPGIVPPWLQKNVTAYPEVVGVGPVGPDTPKIM